MKFVRSVMVAGVVTALVAPLAQAQPAGSADSASRQPAAAPVALPNDGVVRRIDKEQGKVTLRHGPIASLEMPSMTMVFKVANPKLLDGLQEGDKVRFAADRVNGAILVTALEPAK